MMLRLILVLLLCGSLACGFSHIDRDTATRPETVLGTRATILLPGETAPVMPGTGGSSSGTATPAGGSSQSSSQAGPQGQSGGGTVTTTQNGNGQSGSSQSRGSGSEGGTEEMTLLGGSSGESEGERRTRDVPLGPLAILFGYPYWVFGKKPAEQAAEAAQKREEELNRAAQPEGTPRPRTADDVERLRMEDENARMQRELGGEQEAPSGAPAGPPPAGSGSSSALRDELAALERTVGGGSPGEARETMDRDRDGRADLWSVRSSGGERREMVDDDRDGRAERVLHYDGSQRLVRTEEDLDGDGELETTSLYEDGQVSRRRADMDHDRRTDAWTYFEAGEMVRHEVDRNGDGFRDLVMHYRAGELVREELDRNGDGRPDMITHYREGQVAEKHDDVDYDGAPDVASFYENGRLVRRDASSEQALQDWSREAER